MILHPHASTCHGNTSGGYAPSRRDAARTSARPSCRCEIDEAPLPVWNWRSPRAGV